MCIIEQVRNELFKRNQEYIEKVNNYDFWKEHIKYVVDEALKLADELGADKEIVELGALLHDIALVSNVGTRAEHHINGAKIADEILTEFNYPQDKKHKVLNCVLHHRSSKNAENVEELCVCDADILAHFDNIPMIFFKCYTMGKMTLNDIDTMIRGFRKDFDDLSEKTKEEFNDRFQNIMQVLFGENYNQKSADKGDELLHILDENGNPTGKYETREYIHKNELFHNEVALWIIDRKNKKVLLQRRSPNKKANPNKLAICAGHVIGKETLNEALEKEAKEELGLNIKNYDVKKLMTIKRTKPHNHAFSHHYYICEAIPIENITIQKEELSEVLYIDYENLKQKIKQKSEDIGLDWETYEPIFKKLDKILESNS